MKGSIMILHVCSHCDNFPKFVLGRNKEGDGEEGNDCQQKEMTISILPLVLPYGKKFPLLLHIRKYL